nr:HAMP domain-containing sensor histidine kinase [Rhizobium setariae]
MAVAGLALLVVALVVAFFGFSLLFQRHVERRVVAEMTTHLEQIVSGLRLGPDGQLNLEKQPVDPRFTQPLSGLYWQVESGGHALRSRSLWDEDLDLPALDPGAPVRLDLAGPSGTSLVLVMREIAANKRFGGRPVIAAVAVDRTEIDAATAAFQRDIAPYLGLLALLFIAGNWIQIRLGLSPLKALQSRVASVRQGETQRIGDVFPREILPLTREVDELLADREMQIKRAREHAADFAHGLKTPLQALAGDVGRLKERGEVEIAAEIQSLIGDMRQHVDHQLARARMAGRANATAALRLSVEHLVAVLQRTPRGQFLEWTVDVPPELKARIDKDDLTEMLGNLLDNAARYATSEVTISARRAGADIVMEIIDDGPGIPEEKIPQVLRRGGQLDRTSGGAGLGLAISNDISNAVGGSLRLENLDRGLRVTIRLQAAGS